MEIYQTLSANIRIHGQTASRRQKKINGILYVSITGFKWVDMPRTYGTPVTAWRWFEIWREKGGEGRMEQNRSAAECGAQRGKRA